MNLLKHISKTNQTKNNLAEKSLFFQPKLSINQPHDVYEQQADAMADEVMRMTSKENHFFKPAANSVQRKCDHCEQEEKLQMKGESNASGGKTAPSIVHDVINSSGQPLDSRTRNFFEPRFGRGFSDVKIHNNSKATKSAQSINALAYTTGNNIVFNQNQFSPESDGGRKLLAHELTHVLQQKLNGINLQRKIFGGTNYIFDTHQIASQDLNDKDVTDRLSSLTRKELIEYKKHISDPDMLIYIDKLIARLPIAANAVKPKTGKCHAAKTQRWGCDTSCSRAGFIDTENSFKGKEDTGVASECCNKWPPFVEDFARNKLSLNGVGSCMGGMYRTIQKVKFNGKEIRIGCTDSTTSDADHELELSPLAAIDLFGTVDFEKNKQVQTCTDGRLDSLCEKEAKSNRAFPNQIDCLEKTCKPKDSSKKCDGWPRV